MLKPEMTIAEFHKRLLGREFSAEEAARFFIKRIDDTDGEIGAFLEVWREEAIEQAKEADRQIAAGEEMERLAGVLVAVKDNMMVAGQESTGGSKILKGHRAEYDATAVRKIRAAGAVLLGRTNMDELAMGSSTENSAWQITHNPHDKTRVPGGTSGGSAAAVAADMTVAALGSDTGGSIRQPASFCGVVGFRPAYGTVSRYGLIAAASSFDQIGPIAKTVEDAAILFEAVAGKDIFDATSIAGRYRDVTDYDSEKTRELTIGIPAELWDEKNGMFKGTDERTAEQMGIARKILEKAGVKFKTISIPSVKFALPTYYIAIFAEESSNLARLDGLRYGAATEGKTLLELYEKSRGEGFGPEVKRRIILGTFVLSSGFYDAYYGKAQAMRRVIKQDAERVMSEADVIFMPTAPTPAFKIGEKINDPLQMYYGDIFTVLPSLTGQPALSVPVEPVGFPRTGLPVGFQLIGAAGKETKLFNLGRFYEDLSK